MRWSWAAALVFAGLLSGCASDGMVARSRMRGLMSKVPAGTPAKIVVLSVEAERGTAMAGEGTLSDARRIPGVLQADRGGGFNEVLLLVDGDGDPSYFAEALRPRYRTWVVRVVERAELDE